MKCTNCGATLNDGAKFCRNCGAKVEISGAEQSAPVQETPVAEEMPIVSETPIAGEPPATEGINTVKEETPEIYTFEPKVPTPPPAQNVVQPPQKPKSRKGLIGVLIAIIVVLIMAVAAAGTVVYFGFINPVEKDSFLGQIFDEIGLDNFDADDRDYKEDNDNYKDKVSEKNDKETEKVKEENPVCEHSYTVKKEDVTWWQAEEIADDYGKETYLASINTVEEFEELTKMAYDAGIRVLWLGADRDADEEWDRAEWEDDTRFDGLGLWFRGEPSYTDADGGADECYIMAFYVDGKWYLNDSINDVTSIYGGKIGYIIEEEL